MHKLETISDKIIKVLTEHNISLLEIKGFFKHFGLTVNANHLLQPTQVLNELDSPVLAVFNNFFHLPTSCLETGDTIVYRQFGRESEHIVENAYGWDDLQAKTQWLTDKNVGWSYAVLGTSHNVDVIILACATMFHGRVVFSAQPLAHSGPAFKAAYKELEDKLLGSDGLVDLSEIDNDKQGFINFTQDEIGFSQYCFVEFLSERIIRSLITHLFSPE